MTDALSDPGQPEFHASGHFGRPEVNDRGVLEDAIFASLGGSAAGLLLVANATGPQTAHLEQVFTSSFHTTFLVCAGIAAIGIFASLVRGKGDRKKA